MESDNPDELSPKEYDFEGLIKNTKSIDQLRAAAFWEYARESPTFRYIPDLDAALRNSSLSADDKYCLSDFVTGQLSDFPDTPWQALESKIQGRVVNKIFSPHVFVYDSLEAALIALQHSIDRRKKLGIPPAGGLVAILTDSSWQRHGREQLCNHIAAQIHSPRAHSRTNEPMNAWHGLNRTHFAKALRVLGYCRVRTHSGHKQAELWTLKLRARRISVAWGGWSGARDLANEWMHRLFPWLPNDERPLRARSIAEMS